MGIENGYELWEFPVTIDAAKFLFGEQQAGADPAFSLIARSQRLTLRHAVRTVSKTDSMGLVVRKVLRSGDCQFDLRWEPVY